MKSHAQNFEDVVLNRLFRGKTNGFYIDVGAYDPDIDSVTKHFYDLGWSGINIEPVKRFHEKFVALRPRDININCVLGKAGGQVFFKEYGDSGLSTYKEQFNPETVINLGYNKTEYTVESMTLASLAEQYDLHEVDFLKIDVEGAEKEVIEGGDWIRLRPKIILIESIKPKLGDSDPYSYEPTWPEWEGLLTQEGYVFGLFDGLNRFYYRKEDEGLYRFLLAPANVTDGFKVCENHSILPPKKGIWNSILTFRI